MERPVAQLPPGDSALIDKIIYQLKSQGIFDQFRKECLADVDTKPAYQNLQQRVDGQVAGFLKGEKWRADLNKNQLRDRLRKHINESKFLEIGVQRIVDQVVNPKIYAVFLPKVEDVVSNFLGIGKPKKEEEIPVKAEPVIAEAVTNEESNSPSKLPTLKELLPQDLDPISPEKLSNSDGDEEEKRNAKNLEKNEAKESGTDNHSETNIKIELVCKQEAANEVEDEEEESPPFERINSDSNDLCTSKEDECGAPKEEESNSIPIFKGEAFFPTTPLLEENSADTLDSTSSRLSFGSNSENSSKGKEKDKGSQSDEKSISQQLEESKREDRDKKSHEKRKDHKHDSKSRDRKSGKEDHHHHSRERSQESKEERKRTGDSKKDRKDKSSSSSERRNDSSTSDGKSVDKVKSKTHGERDKDKEKSKDRKHDKDRSRERHDSRSADKDKKESDKSSDREKKDSDREKNRLSKHKDEKHREDKTKTTPSKSHSIDKSNRSSDNHKRSTDKEKNKEKQKSQDDHHSAKENKHGDKRSDHDGHHDRGRPNGEKRDKLKSGKDSSHKSSGSTHRAEDRDGKSKSSDKSSDKSKDSKGGGQSDYDLSPQKKAHSQMNEADNKKIGQDTDKPSTDESGKYSACINSSGNVVLKMKKPKIAANIYEVKKIIQARKNIERLERRRMKESRRADEFDSAQDRRSKKSMHKKVGRDLARPNKSKLGKVERDLEQEITRSTRESYGPPPECPSDEEEWKYFDDFAYIKRDFYKRIQAYPDEADSISLLSASSVKTSDLSEWEAQICISDVEVSPEAEEYLKSLGAKVIRNGLPGEVSANTQQLPSSPLPDENKVLAAVGLQRTPPKESSGKAEKSYVAKEYCRITSLDSVKSVYQDSDSADVLPPQFPDHPVINARGSSVTPPPFGEKNKDRCVEEVDAETTSNHLPTPEEDVKSDSQTEKPKIFKPLAKKALPTIIAPQLWTASASDTFMMPLSPDSDVSSVCGDVDKKNHAFIKGSEISEDVPHKSRKRYRSPADCDNKTEQMPRPLRAVINQNDSTPGHVKRYESTDLYKPRPLFGQGSRRTRGLISPTEQGYHDPKSINVVPPKRTSRSFDKTESIPPTKRLKQ